MADPIDKPLVIYYGECLDGFTAAWAVRRHLRSRGDFDVSALAKAFGGGGHAKAAGFTVPKRIH